MNPTRARLKQKICGLLTLARVEGAALTGLLPVFGAFTMTAQLSEWRLLILFLIGVVFSMYVVVLNDVIDVEVDRLLVVWTRPLVSGAVSLNTALGLAGLLLLLSQFLASSFFKIGPRSRLILLVSFGSATIYNVFGKRFPISPIFADMFVGASAGFLYMFGASTISTTLSPLATLLAVYCTVHFLLLNGIDGGLKDIDHDHLVGARTTAYWLGARLEGIDGLIVPPMVKIYSLALEAVLIVLIWVPLVNNWLGYSSGQSLVVGVCLVLLSISAIVLLLRALGEPSFCKARGRLLLHGGPTFYAIPVLLTFYVGIAKVIGLMLLPFAWYLPWRWILAKLRDTAGASRD